MPTAHWTIDIWKKVLFSNESSIKQVESPKSNGVGAVSAMKIASLYFFLLKTTINGTKYVAFLKNKLQLQMFLHNCSIYMHNGGPCHQSRAVKQFLKQENVQVLNWPGNSPDLNPIKNL